MQRRLYIDEAHTALDIFRFAVFFVLFFKGWLGRPKIKFHCIFIDTWPGTSFDFNLVNILVTNNLVNNLVVNILSVVGSLLLVNVVWSSDFGVNVMPWFLGSSQICDNIYEQSCDDTLHKWFLASTWHFQSCQETILCSIYAVQILERDILVIEFQSVLV